MYEFDVTDIGQRSVSIRVTKIVEKSVFCGVRCKNHQVRSTKGALGFPKIANSTTLRQVKLVNGCFENQLKVKLRFVTCVWDLRASNLRAGSICQPFD